MLDFGFQINIYLLVISRCLCWNFDLLGFRNNDVEVSRIAIWRTKAFICIPRNFSGQTVTLAEVPWPETTIQTIFNTKPYPNIETQEVNNCNLLQSAISVDIDSKGRLYVLDKGYGNCRPKILVYNIRTTKEITRVELDGVPCDGLGSMVIDSNNPDSDTRVYIGDSFGNSLIVFSPSEGSWWKLKVKINDNTRNVDVGDYLPENTLIDTAQLAIDKKASTLYILPSYSANLFSLDLSKLRYLEQSSNFSNVLDRNKVEDIVNFEGTIFGNATGLFVDNLGGLNYFYSRFFVLLRWNSKFLLTAEATDVLLQNYEKLPCVVQTFVDSHQQLWVLNSKPNSFAHTYTEKIPDFYNSDSYYSGSY